MGVWPAANPDPQPLVPTANRESPVKSWFKKRPCGPILRVRAILPFIARVMT